MNTLEQVLAWRGRELRSAGGERVGKVEEVYLERDSGEPTWLAVKTGRFGSRRSFVPIEGAAEHDAVVTVPYDRATIRGAPSVAAAGELSPAEEVALYAHYGRDDVEQTIAVDREERFDRGPAGGEPGAAGGGDSGPTATAP